MNCQLDICGNINIILTLLAGGFGWWLVHFFNSARDRINSERTMRTTELANAHSTIVRVGLNGSLNSLDSEGKTIWMHKELEDAIGKIYLYGTDEQISLTKEYVHSWRDTQGAEGKKLADALRNHIRKSLGLTQINGTLDYLVVKLKSNRVP
jgi:hypothetical protein